MVKTTTQYYFFSHKSYTYREDTTINIRNIWHRPYFKDIFCFLLGRLGLADTYTKSKPRNNCFRNASKNMVQ